MKTRMLWMPLVLLALDLPGAVLQAQERSAAPTGPQELRSKVAALVEQRRYEEIPPLLKGLAEDPATDNETRQYALLTLGETYFMYLGKRADALKPLELLVRDFYKDSPYVAKAHYYLGSLYLEAEDAPRAFLHLAEIPPGSPDHPDAQFKLDWASRHLRNVVRLPFGLEISPKRLGMISLAGDLAYGFLYIVMTIFLAAKDTPKKRIGIVLIGLYIVKVLASTALALT